MASQSVSILLKKLRTAGARIGNASNEAKKEIAEITNVLLDPGIQARPEYVDALGLAVDVVTTSPSDVGLATAVRKAVTNQLNRANSIFRIRHMRELTPSVLSVLGLAGFLYVAVPITVLWVPKIETSSLMGIQSILLLMVAVAGGAGSAVSMLVRIQDFAQQKNFDPLAVFLTGFFKPVIGICFALFILFVIKSEIVPVKPTDKEKEIFLFLALGFVAGFSERFARDIISRTEDKIIGKAGPQKGQ